MEGLLAEISKRKAADTGDGKGNAGNKYRRRGEVEREREEARDRAREEQRKRAAEREAEAAEEKANKNRREAEAARNASLGRLAASAPGSGAGSPAPGSGRGSPAPEAEGSGTAADEAGARFNISAEECVRRLRAKGQPIRLFGESDRERRLRLRALELLEEHGTGRGNEFKRVVEDLTQREQERQARGEHAAREEKDDDRRKRYTSEVLDLGLIKSDFNKLHPLIYWNLKKRPLTGQNLLKEWEEWLDARPDTIKRTAQGKLAAANHAQSQQNLKPLFRMLRTRELAEDVVRHLAEVVHYMQVRQYQKANDAYLRLSIGNAAWPIGVTSVGIHERSAREKIQDNVAHVLNDEVSRKYIQAVKRLLTFSQMVRPPDRISLAMG